MLHFNFRHLLAPLQACHAHVIVRQNKGKLSAIQPSGPPFRQSHARFMDGPSLRASILQVFCPRPAQRQAQPRRNDTLEGVVNGIAHNLI